MEFEAELTRVLPMEIPHRDRLIEKSAHHLRLVAAANEHLNLTRISSPREAAIKHVFDSVAPWRYFAHAGRVLDAGSGAGFPGIPLSIVLPEAQFVLAESVHKKARFLEAAVEALELANVEVVAERAESLPVTRRADVITARAVARTHRLLDLFAGSLGEASRLLLYKGPEVEAELAEAGRPRTAAEILYRYELPDGFGSRTLVGITAVRCST